jgi:hypothetical protein
MADDPFTGPLSIAAATRLSEVVALTSIETIAIDAAVDEFVLEKKNLLYNVPNVSVSWAIVQTSISAIFPFKVLIQSRDELGAVKQLAHIGLTLRVGYAVPADASVEDLRQYVAVCGALQCWPYFRTEVHQQSVKIGFPALLLPVLLAKAVTGLIEIGRPAQAPPSDEPADAPHALSETTKPSRAKRRAKRKTVKA